MSRKKKTSVINEIVAGLVVMTLASTALISFTVLWTIRLPGAEKNLTPVILVSYIVLFAVVIAVFGTLLISRTIIRPLKKLLDATEKIRQGNFDIQVQPDAENEMGQLAEAFNRMAEELAKRQKHLEQQLAELEAINHELRKTRDQLIISEKFASVGKLASGIAHEIGNPLSIISGYLEMLSKSKNLDEREKDSLSRVESELKRIHQIIRELLDYSRPPSQAKEMIDLNRVIMESIMLIEAQKGFQKIKTDLYLQQNLPFVLANRNQMKQVLINLLFNALDAMPDGGNLKVKTFVSDNPSDEVCIEIIDTGVGIPPENLTKIFDPFFTTKEPGKGEGLGLSISLNLIEAMNGKIEVESEPGQGSTFRIKLKTGGSKGAE